MSGTLETNTILDTRAKPDPVDVLPSHALWEIPGATGPDQFNVVGYSPLASMLAFEKGKGWTLITTGNAGLAGDWQPLFEKAAAEYPDRRDEFLALAAKCAENRAAADASRKAIPPTKEEIEDMRDARLAKAIIGLQADAQAKADAAPPTKK